MNVIFAEVAVDTGDIDTIEWLCFFCQLVNDWLSLGHHVCSVSIQRGIHLFTRLRRTVRLVGGKVGGREPRLTGFLGGGYAGYKSPPRADSLEHACVCTRERASVCAIASRAFIPVWYTTVKSMQSKLIVAVVVIVLVVVWLVALVEVVAEQVVGIQSNQTPEHSTDHGLLGQRSIRFRHGVHWGDSL